MILLFFIISDFVTGSRRLKRISTLLFDDKFIAAYLFDDGVIADLYRVGRLHRPDNVAEPPRAVHFVGDGFGDQYLLTDQRVGIGPYRSSFKFFCPEKPVQKERKLR